MVHPELRQANMEPFSTLTSPAEILISNDQRLGSNESRQAPNRSGIGRPPVAPRVNLPSTSSARVSAELSPITPVLPNASQINLNLATGMKSFFLVTL